MKNNYGNYVIQKALKIASEGNKRRILDLIIKNLDKIGEKKLILKWRFIVTSYLQILGQGNMYYNNQGFPDGNSGLFNGNIIDQY